MSWRFHSTNPWSWFALCEEYQKAPILPKPSFLHTFLGLLVAWFAWLVDRANPWVASPATYESPAVVLLALPAILHPIRLV